MASFSVCYYHKKLNNQLFIWEGKKTGNFQNSLLLWFTEKYELVIDHLFCALHNMTMIDFEVFYISAKSLKSFLFLLNSHVVWALFKRPSSFIYISFSEVKCWCFITYKNKLKLCVYRLSNKVFVISMDPYIFSSVSIFTLPSFQSTVEFNDLKPFVCKTCLTILIS